MENEIKQLNKEWQVFKLALYKSLKLDKLIIWLSKFVAKM